MALTLSIPLNDDQSAWAGGIIAADDADADITEALTALATDALVAALASLSIERALTASNEAENERRKDAEDVRLAAFPKPERKP